MTSLPPAASGRPAGRRPALIGLRRGFLTACLPYSGKVHSRGNRTAPAASCLSKVGSEGTSCASHVALVVRMKSGGPWNLRGLRPEAREAVRTAARRSGVSVGEWLNDVIEPDDEEDDDEPTLFSDYDDEDDDERPRRSRSRRDEPEPRRRGEDREPRQRGDERGARRRADDRELRQRDEDQEPREPRRDRLDQPRPERDSEFQRESARTRGALNQIHSRLDKLSQQLERLARSEAAARQLAP